MFKQIVPASLNMLFLKVDDENQSHDILGNSSALENSGLVIFGEFLINKLVMSNTVL